MIEIYSNKLKKWILVDLDIKYLFKKRDKYLSLLELSSMDFKNVELELLSDAPVIDYSGFNEYHTIAEYNISNPRKFYNRVLKIAGIKVFEDKVVKHYFINNKKISPETKKWIKEFDFHFFLDKEDFKNKFYN